jgi:hypothetical protein
MSNDIAVQLDVLASSPQEINDIQRALQNPCTELIAWSAQRAGREPATIAADVREIVAFKPIENLGDTDPSVNKARRFESVWQGKNWGLVWSHVYFVSRDFPEAIFLAEYWDPCMSYAGKIVIRGGRDIRGTHDGNQRAQGYEWTLLDIFAPYLAEYRNGAEFGSLWDIWLVEMTEAVSNLKSQALEPGRDCGNELSHTASPGQPLDHRQRLR